MCDKWDASESEGYPEKEEAMLRFTTIGKDGMR